MISKYFLIARHLCLQEKYDVFQLGHILRQVKHHQSQTTTKYNYQIWCKIVVADFLWAWKRPDAVVVHSWARRLWQMGRCWCCCCCCVGSWRKCVQRIRGGGCKRRMTVVIFGGGRYAPETRKQDRKHIRDSPGITSHFFTCFVLTLYVTKTF